MFCFFPLIGILTGLLEFLWLLLAKHLGIHWFMTASFALAFPVLITGGIHLDGFLDTADALASWKTREERLAIMHDPHAGAFAVIFCALYFLTALGAVTEAVQRGAYAACFIFCVSRLYTAVLVVFEQPAGKIGMLYQCTQHAVKRAVLISTAVYTAGMAAAAIWFSVLRAWIILMIMGAVVLLIYRMFLRRVFGGITGDLAGCYLSVCELILVITAVFAR